LKSGAFEPTWGIASLSMQCLLSIARPRPLSIRSRKLCPAACIEFYHSVLAVLRALSAMSALC
jgi:hypothetical protein